MKPAARLQAAIELLGEVEAGDMPVDRLAANFFRARRYAGSKDRADITERVYTILRRRGELAWSISRAASEITPRSLVFADLVCLDLLPAEGRERWARKQEHESIVKEALMAAGLTRMRVARA